MTLITLRPNGDIATTMSVTGAATAWQALSDNSDASYLDNSAAGQAVEVDLTNLTLPAGAVVRDLACRIRQSNGVDPGPNDWRVELWDSVAIVNQLLSSTSAITTISTFVYPPPPGGVNLDGLRLIVKALEPGDGVSSGASFLYEAYVDVTYVVKPVVVVNTIGT